MKAVIIEDEIVAAQSLQHMLVAIDASIEVVAVLQSVEESVEWFRSNGVADIVFMDIHLADGSAFQIFEQVQVTVPIIFTTAYDQYAIQAFKVNSIDYLLKPIQQSDLQQALQKYRRLQAENNVVDVRSLLSQLHQQHAYKSYFLIPFREHLEPVSTAEIACIYIDDKTTKILLLNGKSYAVDKPLDAYMQQLDPQKFFRANRQVVVGHSAIKNISLWFAGKLTITLTVPFPEKIIISKARIAEFKEWYTR